MVWTVSGIVLAACSTGADVVDGVYGTILDIIPGGGDDDKGGGGASRFARSIGVADGPVFGALLFTQAEFDEVDDNDDGTLTQLEIDAWVAQGNVLRVTDENGVYTPTAGSVPITGQYYAWVDGKTDTSTGQTLTGHYRSLPGGGIATPITNLMADYIDEQGLDGDPNAERFAFEAIFGTQSVLTFNDVLTLSLYEVTAMHSDPAQTVETDPTQVGYDATEHKSYLVTEVAIRLAEIEANPTAYTTLTTAQDKVTEAATIVATGTSTIAGLNTAATTSTTAAQTVNQGTPIATTSPVYINEDAGQTAVEGTGVDTDGAITYSTLSGTTFLVLVSLERISTDGAKAAVDTTVQQNSGQVLVNVGATASVVDRVGSAEHSGIVFTSASIPSVGTADVTIVIDLETLATTTTATTAIESGNSVTITVGYDYDGTTATQHGANEILFAIRSQINAGNITVLDNPILAAGTDGTTPFTTAEETTGATVPVSTVTAGTQHTTQQVVEAIEAAIISGRVTLLTGAEVADNTAPLTRQDVPVSIATRDGGITLQALVTNNPGVTNVQELFFLDTGGNTTGTFASDGGILINATVANATVLYNGAALAAGNAPDQTGLPASGPTVGATFFWIPASELSNLTIRPTTEHFTGTLAVEYYAYDGEAWTDTSAAATLSVIVMEVDDGATTVAASNVVSRLGSHVDATGGIKIADLAITDSDGFGDDSLVLGGASAGRFELRAVVGNPNAAELWLREGAFGIGNFDVTVSIPGVNPSDPDAVVTTFFSHTLVVESNQAPTNLSLSSRYFTRVGDTVEISVTDPNHADTHTNFPAINQAPFVNAFTIRGTDMGLFATKFGDNNERQLELNADGGKTHYAIEIFVKDPLGGEYSEVFYLTTVPLYIDVDGDLTTAAITDRFHSGSFSIEEEYDATASGERRLGTLGAESRGTRLLTLADATVHNDNNLFRFDLDATTGNGVLTFVGADSGNADANQWLDVEVEYLRGSSIRAQVEQAGGGVPADFTLYELTTNANMGAQILVDTPLTEITANSLVHLSLYSGALQPFEIVSRVEGLTLTAGTTVRVYAVIEGGHWNLRATDSGAGSATRIFDLVIAADGTVTVSGATDITANGSIRDHAPAARVYLTYPTVDITIAAGQYLYEGDRAPGGAGGERVYFTSNVQLLPRASTFIEYSQALTITVFNPDGSTTEITGNVTNPGDGDSRTYNVYVTTNNTIGQRLETSTTLPTDFAFSLFTVNKIGSSSSTQYQVDDIAVEAFTSGSTTAGGSYTFQGYTDNKGIVENTETLRIRLEDINDEAPTVAVTMPDDDVTEDNANDQTANGVITINDADAVDDRADLDVRVAAGITAPTQTSTQVVEGETTVAGQYGTFTLTRTATGDITWVYTLNSDVDLAGGATETDTLSVIVYDSSNTAPTAGAEEITVNIAGTNDAPTVRSGNTRVVFASIDSNSIANLETSFTVADSDTDVGTLTLNAHASGSASGVPATPVYAGGSGTAVASSGATETVAGTYGTFRVTLAADGGVTASYNLDESNTVVRALAVGSDLVEKLTVYGLDGTDNSTPFTYQVTINGAVASTAPPPAPTNNAPTITYDTTATGGAENDGTVTVTATGTFVGSGFIQNFPAVAATNGGQVTQNFDIADSDAGDALSLHTTTAFTANATTDPDNAAFSTATAPNFASGGAIIEGQYGNFFILYKANDNITVWYGETRSNTQAAAINALTADSVEELVIYAYDGTDESATPIEYLVELDIA
jgi:VCBS repeat-containing protein